MATEGETKSDICKVLRIRESHPAFVGYRTIRTIKFPYAEGYREYNKLLLESYKKFVSGNLALPSSVENAVKARMAETYSQRVREAEIMDKDGLTDQNIEITVNPKLPSEVNREEEATSR